MTKPMARNRVLILVVVVVVLLAGGGYLISRVVGGGGQARSIDLTVRGTTMTPDNPTAKPGDKLGEEAVVYPRWRAAWLDGPANAAWPRAVGGTIGVLGLLAVVVTGWFGSQKSFYSPAEYLVWVYFWAGTVILTGLVGNLWALFNPYAALQRTVAAIGLWPKRESHPAWRWGIWPAIAAYFSFACLELTSGVASRPAILAALAVIYALVTLLGMATFGAETWLDNAEGFTVLFGIVSRFGPIETEREPQGKVRVWLRILGSGLLKGERAGWDRVVFVVLMLSSLAFDGILATPLNTWSVLHLGPVFPPLGGLQIPVL